MHSNSIFMYKKASITLFSARRIGPSSGKPPRLRSTCWSVMHRRRTPKWPLRPRSWNPSLRSSCACRIAWFLLDLLWCSNLSRCDLLSLLQPFFTCSYCVSHGSIVLRLHSHSIAISNPLHYNHQLSHELSGCGTIYREKDPIQHIICFIIINTWQVFFFTSHRLKIRPLPLLQQAVQANHLDHQHLSH